MKLTIENQGALGWAVMRGDETVGRCPTREIARTVRAAVLSKEVSHGPGTVAANEGARETLRMLGLEDCLS